MRPDMAKVVTERPRRGHHNRSQKTGKRFSAAEIASVVGEAASAAVNQEPFEYDAGPTKHPVSRKRQYGWDAKEFTDRLGPLRRYLRKQVGRPWNKIWSELSANLDKRSVTGSHIFDHVKLDVEQRVEMVGGVPMRSYSHFLQRYEIDGFYVDPRTGLLCFRAPTSWRKVRKEREQQRAALQKFFGRDYHNFITSDRSLKDYVVVSDTILMAFDNERRVWFTQLYRRLDPNAVVRTDEINGRVYHRTRRALKMPEIELVSSRSACRSDILNYIR